MYTQHTHTQTHIGTHTHTPRPILCLLFRRKCRNKTKNTCTVNLTALFVRKVLYDSQTLSVSIPVLMPLYTVRQMLNLCSVTWIDNQLHDIESILFHVPFFLTSLLSHLRKILHYGEESSYSSLFFFARTASFGVLRMGGSPDDASEEPVT